MDMQVFFNRLRTSNHIFPNGRLTQPQVDGINPVVITCQHLNIQNPHFVANILAQIYHETGGYMFPIKETVFGSHKDKNPSDATVIQRLDNAYARGQLPWVSKPYWRDGWFGRGQIQITHKDNYKRLGDRLGIDLVGNRDLALNPQVSASIAIVGMMEGVFTGKKLPDYNFPQAVHNPVETNPRRIVNGKDGTDAKVAKYHIAFHEALAGAGYSTVITPTEPTPDPIPAPIPEIDVRTRAQIVAEIRSLLDELDSLE